jgi:peptide deformylase
MADVIVTEGTPVLREKAKEVPKAMFGTHELNGIIARMSASLRTTHNGVAIAAPQIGIGYRVFVVAGFVIQGHPRNLEDPDVAFINPKLVKKSRKKDRMEEGCLSVPGMYGMVVRSLKASIKAHDIEGKKFERGGTGLLAQIFQHECDHLEGILFVDSATDLHKEEPKDRTTPKPDEEKS